MPPPPPEKTGKFRIPARRNRPTAEEPRIGPKMRPERTAKKFCKTMGTGPMGMTIKAPAAVSAAKSAVREIFFSALVEFVEYIVE